MVTYITNDRLPWKGYSWVWIQNDYTDRSCAWVDDDGNLHQVLQRIGGVYKGTLFETPTPVRYGRMTWVASSPSLNYERGTSLGFCTYLSDPTPSTPDKNELDIELNQWTGYDDRCWFTIQPGSLDTHPDKVYYGVKSDSPYVNQGNITYIIEWTPSYVYYGAIASNGDKILEWTYSDASWIPDDAAYICMDVLTLMGGAGPTSGNSYELVLSNFTYDNMVIAANFSADVRSGTTNTTFQFTDTSTGLPSTWLWNFGDGTTSTAQNPTHNYTTAGTYTVTLTASNAVSSDVETKTSYMTVTQAAAVAPVAAFSATPRSGTKPLTVAFTDQSTNIPTSWAWNFGDSTTSTAQHPSHIYSAAGTYTVTLTVSNAAGSDGETKTSYITVSEPTAPTLYIMENIIKNSSFELWSSGTSEVAPDNWYLSTDTSTTGGNARSSDPATGSYSMSITGDGSQAYHGHILHFPGVTNAPKRLDAWVKKIGSATGGLEFFVWNGAENYKSVQAAQIGSDVWTHFEWSLTSMPATESIEVDVYTDNSANGVWLVDNVQISDTVQIFSVTETVTSSYVRSTFTYSPTGVYSTSNICYNFSTYPLTDYDIDTIAATIDGTAKTVWFRDNYVYIDASGLSTSPHTVVITANRSVASVPPVANFTGTPTSGTEPLTVAFTDTSTNYPASWSWNFGDGTTSAVRDPTHQYMTHGTYTVSLTATNAAGSDTESKAGYITVNAATVPPVANFSADSTTGTAPFTVTFTDQSTNAPTSWSWSFGDGTTAVDQNPIHVYSVSGTYTVTLTATNGAGSDGETKAGYITVSSRSPTYWYWYWFSKLWR